MLSTVLRSERAIQANIAIMRAFVKLRQMLATHRALARKVISMERRYDANFAVVFQAIRRLQAKRRTSRPKPRRIGFGASV